MDFGAYVLAFGQDWITLMSGIASVILAIIGVAKKWDRVPRWAFILAALICFFVASGRIWTTEHRARVQLESTHPYVVLEALPAETVRSMNIVDGRRADRPDAAYDRSFVTERYPDNSWKMYYNVRNTSKVDEARNIRYYDRIELDGRLKSSDDPSESDKGHVLVPEQFMNRGVNIPNGVFNFGSGLVRIKLLVTFSGAPSDKKIYYYKTVVTQKQYADEADFAIGPSRMNIESQDEGVFTGTKGLID
jgi:hypothetical protein